jgi:hypothetical protein
MYVELQLDHIFARHTRPPKRLPLSLPHLAFLFVVVAPEFRLAEPLAPPDADEKRSFEPLRTQKSDINRRNLGRSSMQRRVPGTGVFTINGRAALSSVQVAL